VGQYKAIARREGKCWAIEVQGVGWTQARRLDEAEHLARDLVAAVKNVDIADVAVFVEPHVSDELDELRARAARLSRDAEEAAAQAQAEKRRLIRELKAANLSARDIGRLAGVSHQRVSQLTSGTPT
jgi:hypothetical protein